MVERELPKLSARVRFPSPAPDSPVAASFVTRTIADGLERLPAGSQGGAARAGHPLTPLRMAQIMRGYFPGGVPERSKGSDCKSDGSAFGGSNPPPSTIWIIPSIAVMAAVFGAGKVPARV